MNNFSPNMLKTFEACPQKYCFKYVQRISMPQKSALFEKGKKVHALANYYLRGDDISKLETSLNAREREVWERLKQNEYFNKVYVASEYNLSCKVGDYWVGGRLDAVVKDECATFQPLNSSTAYYILDYKTGQIPKNPENDFQTTIYLLCASKKFDGNIKFVYIDLKNNQNRVIDFSPETALKYEKNLKEICKKISEIQPIENIEHSSKCDFCEYKKICI